MIHDPVPAVESEAVDPPLALIAELTHRCPLRCPYCSNPLALHGRDAELASDEWLGVFEQARAIGVLQVHLSGGEPAMRSDLELLVERATGLHLFVNLITSGIGLDRGRVERLAGLGLNSVQLSFQAADAALGDRIAGRAGHEEKLRVARAVRDAGVWLTANVVLHRLNIDGLEALVELLAGIGAVRIELANVQLYGWALANRAALLPTRDQVRRATSALERVRVRLDPGVEVVWVPPDYHTGWPKPCMGGWGRTSLTVSPDGTVLPCPAAASISSLRFESVRDRPLEWIWRRSASFNAYRGLSWMPDPCRTCDRRSVDFGGCRCQAFALTGDAGRTDPACRLAPDHAAVVSAVQEAEGPTGPPDGPEGPALRYRHMTRRSLALPGAVRREVVR